MDFLCKYFLGPLLLTGILIGVFEIINPKSWPKHAVGVELAACWFILLAGLGRNQAQEEKERKAAEMEKFLAELRSKEQVELEKHRLTLEAQKQETNEAVEQRV